MVAVLEIPPDERHGNRLCIFHVLIILHGLVGRAIAEGYDLEIITAILLEVAIKRSTNASMEFLLTVDRVIVVA
jgi:hypothetical protein